MCTAQNDNIFIDGDGRIKVADFGEVRQHCALLLVARAALHVLTLAMLAGPL